MSLRPLGIFALLISPLLLSGCTSETLPTAYGRTSGPSINGLSAFASLLRDRGFTVKVTTRLDDRVRKEANTIVRVPPYAGPPGKKEADWYREWLSDDPDHLLIYVARGYDAEPEYWAAVLAGLPPSTPPEKKAKIQKFLDASQGWPSRIPRRDATKAEEDAMWGRIFSGTGSLSGSTLEGSFTEGVDLKGAAVGGSKPLLVPPTGSWEVPLGTEKGALVLIGREGPATGGMLILGDGSFLLNGSMLNRARRPLTSHVVDWLDFEGGRRVVFVEGGAPADRAGGGPAGSSSMLNAGDDPISWIKWHILLGLGLVGSLYLAARLGRARTEPPPMVGRPSEHAEALGDLLARTRKAESASALLEAYRRWRIPTRTM